MRKFKKALAVVSAAVMTMAMSVSAFADTTTVTYHFYNANNWDNVGAWVKQSIDWTEECLPTDKCVTNQVIGDDGLTYTKPLWPGAKMESEGNGWYKVTCTYTAPEKGTMMIFNNYVGDATATDTTTDEDIVKLREAGVTLNDTAEKLQTPNIMIGKNALTATEYWINWDGQPATLIAWGKSDMITDTAPANYTVGSTEAPAAEDPTTSAGTTPSDAGTATSGTGTGTGSTSTTTAPTTGDTVAVSIVLIGLASAVAVVVAKKKVNA